MEFVQTIGFKTTRVDEIMQLDADLKEISIGNPRGFLLKDRERQDLYMVVLTFDSYDDAMKNNDLPETQAFAIKMAELCDSPPAFGNYDLIERFD